MCAPIWERLDARLDDIPADGMLFAAAELHLTLGPASLLVDVDDLDADLLTHADEKRAAL